MKCSDCKSRKYCDNADKVNYCAGYIFDDSKPKMQTNEEWLNSLSTEEKANFLNQIVRVGPYENEPKDFWKYVYGGGGDRGEKSIVEWLKQPHSEVKND